MAELPLGADGLPVRPVRSWNDDKLYYVARYTDIFTTGMKNQWGSLVYADFFAGPGRCLIEGDREVDGSPLAAASRPGFNRLFFNDLDPVAVDALTTRLAGEPTDRVRISRADCNDAVDEAREFLFPANLRSGTLGLAFIDPTAYQMSFESIKRFTAGVRVDLIINFMTDYAKRFVRTDYWREGSDFDQFMGTRDWLRLKRDVPTAQLKSELLAIYRRQLESLGYHVDDSVLVRNSQQRGFYHLIYASNHPRGLEFWRKISATESDQRRRLFEY